MYSTFSVKYFSRTNVQQVYTSSLRDRVNTDEKTSDAVPDVVTSHTSHFTV